MIDYTKLDHLILTRVREGNTDFVHIFGGEVRDEATQLGRLFKRDEMRVLDGRLQALRKQGKLKFTRADGWTVVKENSNG